MKKKKSKKIKNKMKRIIKQKESMKMVIIILILLIGLPVLVSASIYDTLQSLKTRNCNLIERNSVSSSFRTDLINKFGLTGGGGCDFVIDYMPFHPDTVELLWFNYTWYAEIDYIFNGNDEYLLLLGVDKPALEDMINFAVNYELFENLLSDYDEVFLYDPDYTEPSPNNCVDNAIESIYLGNEGSYEDDTGATIDFTSSCINENIIKYPYCEDKVFWLMIYYCDCVGGKCISSASDVFWWLDLFGLSTGPRGREIDSDFLSSAISSWINN